MIPPHFMCGSAAEAGDEVTPPKENAHLALPYETPATSYERFLGALRAHMKTRPGMVRAGLFFRSAYATQGAPSSEILWLVMAGHYGSSPAPRGLAG